NMEKYIYNKSSTLIILDWDDTLFPTSWLTNNQINLHDINSKTKYSSYFKRLDTVLFNLLSRLSKFGKVIIITNALPVWIKLTSTVLPNTSKLLENIKIISARKIYQSKHGDMMEWKKNVFKDEVAKEIYKKEFV